MGLNQAITVGELLSGLLPRLANPDTRHLPPWPPDAFGLMAVLIQRSGAYTRVLEKFPRSRWGIQSAEHYVDWVSKHARQWVNAYVEGTKDRKNETKAIWDALLKHSWSQTIEEFAESSEQSHNALLVMAIADEASAGLGIPVGEGLHTGQPLFNERVWERLLKAQPLFQDELDLSRITVLGKRRTPQSGLNARSLSHHLCAIEGCEVPTQWVLSMDIREAADHVNVLLLPWPFEISPKAFRPVSRVGGEMLNMPDGFGFFAYSPALRGDVKSALQSALKRAMAEVDHIDFVVLPECAVNRHEWDLLANVALEYGFTLIAGVEEALSDDAPEGINEGRNEVWIQGAFGGKLEQSKHHRWQLERTQILNYQLASRLDPEKRWWERIPLTNRKASFLQLNSWLCAMPLICEDLARPDPVGEIVRSVGPDLVIALLMDGPQLLSRWTARNAMNLADDPGCSVLTLTSLGMIKLSNTRQKNPRVVPALFKDPIHGAQEIEFPPGVEAAVLTLSRTPRKEWTADGREDHVSNSCPTLASIRFLQLDKKQIGR